MSPKKFFAASVAAARLLFSTSLRRLAQPHEPAWMLFPRRSGSVSDVAIRSWRGFGLQATPTAEKRPSHRDVNVRPGGLRRSGNERCALSLASPGFVPASHAAALLIDCSSNRSCSAILLGVTPCTELQATPTRWLIAALAAVRSDLSPPALQRPARLIRRWRTLSSAERDPPRIAAWSMIPALCDTCAPTDDRSSTNKGPPSRARFRMISACQKMKRYREKSKCCV